MSLLLQVTFRDPESARRACEDATPIIDGRRANCNLASLGAQNRSRPMFPFGHGERAMNFHYDTLCGVIQYIGLLGHVEKPVNVRYNVLCDIIQDICLLSWFKQGAFSFSFYFKSWFVSHG